MKNYTIEDFRECRNLIESKNKMLGINAPTKTDITTNGKDLNLNSDEREERIAILIAKAQKK